ncbi:hypothetical protein H311_00878 [Anncaliia algerae PRA109]|nr:hypothetical protein H311_00878 [Anncaliia algerae PRA109]
MDIKRFLSRSYKPLNNIKCLLPIRSIRFLACNPIRLKEDSIEVYMYELILSHAVKCHRQRVARNQSWPLTIVETNEEPGLGYFQIAEKRDKSTRIKITLCIVRQIQLYIQMSRKLQLTISNQFWT